MKKQGFTLVGLLVVLVLVIGLSIIIVPNVLNNTVSKPKDEDDKGSAKSVLFFTEAREILRSAKDQYLIDNMLGGNTSKIYGRVNGNDCSNTISNVKENISYYIEFNNEGNIIKYYATDGIWLYAFIGDNTHIIDLNSINENNFKLYEENSNKYSVSCNKLERVS